MASETIRSIRTVKSFANEELEANKYKEKLDELYEASNKDINLKPIMQMFEHVSMKATTACYHTSL